MQVSHPSDLPRRLRLKAERRGEEADGDSADEFA
jgi:hypothetical protein